MNRAPPRPGQPSSHLEAGRGGAAPQHNAATKAVPTSREPVRPDPLAPRSWQPPSPAFTSQPPSSRPLYLPLPSHITYCFPSHPLASHTNHPPTFPPHTYFLSLFSMASCLTIHLPALPPPYKCVPSPRLLTKSVKSFSETMTLETAAKHKYYGETRAHYHSSR